MKEEEKNSPSMAQTTPDASFGHVLVIPVLAVAYLVDPVQRERRGGGMASLAVTV